MGILPLQFVAGENAQSLNLTGEEIFEISAVSDLVRKFAPGKQLKVDATSPGHTKEFHALARIDTPQEAQYYANGGILHYVQRQLQPSKPSAVPVQSRDPR